MKKLEYSIIGSVNSNDNPIAKEGWYDECQIAEFTGCWLDDKYYEVLFYKDNSYYLDENGNLCDDIDTEDWKEDDQIYIYFDEDSNRYFEQITNGNHWYEITEPKLIDC